MSNPRRDNNTGALIFDPSSEEVRINKLKLILKDLLEILPIRNSDKDWFIKRIQEI